MTILCIVSDQPGHLDFGGAGYLRLVQRLRDRGNRIAWLTKGRHATKLRAAGFEVFDFNVVGDLFLGRLLQAATTGTVGVESLRALNELQSRLGEISPTLVVCDRALAFAPLAFEHLRIPYVAMGTPGGTWKYSGQLGISPQHTPVEEYAAVTARAARSLGWQERGVSSCWIESPWLNVAFLGKTFFPEYCRAGAGSAFVRHYTSNDAADGDRIGVSFGNTGNVAVMTRALHALIAAGSKDTGIDVFTGGRPELQQAFSRTLAGERVRIHGWVDFREYFSKLSALVFFGGIGTAWECINQRLPMITLPGSAGDQYYNAAAIEKLGLGFSISDPQLIEERVVRYCSGPPSFREAAEAFRSQENHSDTLDSVCERIESLG